MKLKLRKLANWLFLSLLTLFTRIQDTPYIIQLWRNYDEQFNNLPRKADMAEKTKKHYAVKFEKGNKVIYVQSSTNVKETRELLFELVESYESEGWVYEGIWEVEIQGEVK